jgi:hypothetical protein
MKGGILRVYKTYQNKTPFLQAIGLTVIWASQLTEFFESVGTTVRVFSRFRVDEYDIKIL